MDFRSQCAERPSLGHTTTHQVNGSGDVAGDKITGDYVVATVLIPSRGQPDLVGAVVEGRSRQGLAFHRDDRYSSDQRSTNQDKTSCRPVRVTVAAGEMHRCAASDRWLISCKCGRSLSSLFC